MSLLIHAQPVFGWAHQFGDTAIDKASCVALDNNGNIFLLGFYSGTIDLDPGPGTVYVTAAVSSEVFCCKLTPGGNFIFGKKISGRIKSVNSAVVDGQGNLIFCGTFDSIVDFNPDAGSAVYDASNGRMFVSKWNAQGQYMWTSQFGNDNDTCDATAVCVTDSGEVLVTGFFSGSSDFEPGAGFSFLSSYGKTDIFYLKLNKNGAYQFSGQLGGLENERANDVSCDHKGQIYLTGSFHDTVDMNPGAAQLLLYASDTSSDAFVCKLKQNGTLDWAISFGGPASDGGKAIDVDDCGNVFSTGVFHDTVDADPSDEMEWLVSDSLADGYIMKTAADGSLRWVRRLAGKGNDTGWDVQVNLSGDVFVSGMYEKDFFAGDNQQQISFTGSGQADVFVLKYNSLGNLICAGSMGGALPDSLATMNITPKDEIFLCGFFSDSSDVDLSSDSVSMLSAGYADAFVSKHFPGTCCVSVVAAAGAQSFPDVICQGESSLLTITPTEKETCPNWKWHATSCGGMSLGKGDTVVIFPVVSGMYFVRQEGPCDTSLCMDVFVNVEQSPIADVEMKLTADCKGIAVTFQNKSLFAQSYFWQFGNGNSSMLETPPEQHFNFNATLQFTLVAINLNGCRDTIRFSQSLADFETYYHLRIPNVFSPNGDNINDEFFIEYEGNFSSCFHVDIFDRWGLTVFSSNDPGFRWNGKTLEGRSSTPGTYYYVIQIGDKKHRGFLTLAD